MATPKFDVTAVFETYRSAFEPALRAQQDGLKVLERMLRYQYAVAGDLLDWSLSAAKAGVVAKNVADLSSEQQALGGRLGEQLKKRADEFTQIATEVRGTVTHWFDEATAQVSEVTKKAA